MPLQALWEDSIWPWYDPSMQPASIHALQLGAYPPLEPWYTPEDVPQYKDLAPLTLDPSAYLDEDCPFSLMPVQSLTRPVALRAEHVWHVMEDADLREYWRLGAGKAEPQPLQNPINRQIVQRSSSVRRVIWYARVHLPMTPPTSPEPAPPKRRRV
jgi:hypothetical protein